MDRSEPGSPGWLLAGIVIFLSAATLHAQWERAGVIVKRYADLCASCHGARMEGGTASSLLDDVWHNGGDDESIARSIREGFPDRGMPAWSGALPEKEVRAFVIYIKEMRSKHWRENAAFPQPAASIEFRSRLHAFRLETWIDGLKEPWGIAFLPGDRVRIPIQARLRIARGLLDAFDRALRDQFPFRAAVSPLAKPPLRRVAGSGRTAPAGSRRRQTGRGGNPLQTPRPHPACGRRPRRHPPRTTS